MKACPAVDLVGKGNAPRPPVDRSAEADSHRLGRFRKLRQRLFNVRQNAGCPQRRINVEPKAVDDAPVGVARDELQLGTANFDAQIHK